MRCKLSCVFLGVCGLMSVSHQVVFAVHARTAVLHQLSTLVHDGMLVVRPHDTSQALLLSVLGDGGEVSATDGVKGDVLGLQATSLPAR